MPLSAIKGLNKQSKRLKNNRKSFAYSWQIGSLLSKYLESAGEKCIEFLKIHIYVYIYGFLNKINKLRLEGRQWQWRQAYRKNAHVVDDHEPRMMIS